MQESGRLEKGGWRRVRGGRHGRARKGIGVRVSKGATRGGAGDRAVGGVVRGVVAEVGLGRNGGLEGAGRPQTRHVWAPCRTKVRKRATGERSQT